MNTEVDTLSRIKLTALILFNEKGYYATTTREIANEVGIKSSTLYFYFKSKEEIFFILYKEARELYEIKKDKALSQNGARDVEEQIYNLFSISMEFFREHNLYSRFLYRHLIYPVYGVQSKIESELQEWKGIASIYLFNLFEKGIQEGLFRNLSSDDLSRTFYRNLNGYIYELITSNRIPSKEEVDKVWRVYWDSIKA
ncbi:TetR/AcrR family transcriptional regulator [Clostridium swellfunianum]|uniref:TetR/AcrR family transcriptional regulator n=1 Tax=Clostridium swellfunianum TaxID=1367462 RepID=UPI002030ECB2|nr:TetR/AcrR family transcriptional regulator [Clostridium swellfunianum]MCM0648065.1 TetR/AcrR family transcriptional regulator [Clostridium swellfunianum]